MVPRGLSEPSRWPRLSSRGCSVALRSGLRREFPAGASRGGPDTDQSQALGDIHESRPSRPKAVLLQSRNEREWSGRYSEASLSPSSRCRLLLSWASLISEMELDLRCLLAPDR